MSRKGLGPMCGGCSPGVGVGRVEGAAGEGEGEGVGQVALLVMGGASHVESASGDSHD